MTNNMQGQDILYPPDFIRAETVEDLPGSLKKLTFPGGFACVTHSPGEAELIYNEMIVKQEYLQHGLSLEGARCVFDVGANIGMFTMNVKQIAPDAEVYSFEPIPDTFQVLEQNACLQGCPGVHLFNVALGSEDHTEIELTYFPNMAGNSTALPGLKQERRPVMDQIFGKELSAFLYQSETRTAQVRTLSSIIAEQGITGIDYLKIDVEGAELSVLDGIADAHWPIIRQVAVEAHSNQWRDEVCERLAQRGFEVYTDLGLSSPVEVSLVYAKRAG